MVEWKNGTAIALFSRSKVTYKSETQGIKYLYCIGIVKASIKCPFRDVPRTCKVDRGENELTIVSCLIIGSIQL